MLTEEATWTPASRYITMTGAASSFDIDDVNEILEDQTKG